MSTTESIEGQDWDVRREVIDTAVCVRRWAQVGNATLVVLEEHDDGDRPDWSQIGYTADINKPATSTFAVKSYADPEQAQRVANRLVAVLKAQGR